MRKSHLFLWIFSTVLILSMAGCKFLQKEAKRETIFDKTVSISKAIQDMPYLPPLCDEIEGLKKGFADIEDGKLYYEEEGQGIPVVLINGGPGGTHHIFHPYFSKIKDIARVIYYDQRGTGKSSKDGTGKTYTVKQAVEDLESLRKSLKIDRWVVLGWSYGGLLAQYYALTYPDRCLGMVLGVSEITLYKINEDPKREKMFLSQEESAALRNIDEEARKGKVTPGQIFYNKQLAGDWKRSRYYKPTREELIRGILYGWAPGPDFVEKMRSDMYTIKLQGKFDNFEIPTLIVEGKWELLWWDTYEDRVELWRKNHPHAKIEIFEKSGHMIFADEPDKFFALLRDFLRKSSKEEVAHKPKNRLRRNHV